MSTVSKVLAGVLLASALVVTPGARAQASSSGVNDWSCQPSAAHPHAVVLLHGLGAPAYDHWSYHASYLAGRGWCVFYPTYGQGSPLFLNGGLRPIAESAEEVADYVDDVLAATGTAEVDLVGHSEGGFLSLYIPKMLNFGAKVHRAFAMASPTHGTSYAGVFGLADGLGIRATVNLLVTLFGCGACNDMVTGGPAVMDLNDGPVTVPGVEYTILASRFDVLVTPTETAFVYEPGVTNRYVQDTCPLDPVGHVGLAFDSGVGQMIANALDPAHATPVTCGIGPPV
ncbi:MAG TPA: alpha/beta fold hydrolase [Acidimicrobiales bacterium]|nr:alpha/beta fold hydrolase [Acidimicrobiales bacterium]